MKLCIWEIIEFAVNFYDAGTPVHEYIIRSNLIFANHNQKSFIIWSIIAWNKMKIKHHEILTRFRMSYWTIDDDVKKWFLNLFSFVRVRQSVLRLWRMIANAEAVVTICSRQMIDLPILVRNFNHFDDIFARNSIRLFSSTTPQYKKKK